MNSVVKKSIAFIGKANYADAVYLLKKTLRSNPKDVQALNILGQVQIKLAEYGEAIKNLEKSISINSFDHEILARLAYAYEKSGSYQEAIGYYRKSLAIKPDQGHIYDCMGRALAKDEHNYEAILYFLKALEFFPTDRDIHKNIGYVAKDTGLYELCLKHYAIARDLDPSDEQSLSCLIFNSHKNPQASFADLQELAVAYSEQVLPQAERSYKNEVGVRLDQNKAKLSLGFVSADLRGHPVSYYLFKVLEKMNKDEFEIYLYCNNQFNDDLTQSFRDISVDFTCVTKMGDAELAEKIYQDQVDVLFDLSGFTKGQRLAVFKYQAAPVQVSHIGYFGTLGMKEMDFVITDSHLVKPEEEQYFTEQVYKMDPSLLHCASLDVPEPNKQAPCNVNGHISFGSMNSPHKISQELIGVWSQILKANPSSKLIIDNQFLETDSNQEFVRQSFAKHDIGLDRVELRSSTQRNEFLQTYSDIDVALDTFPYGGGSSTVEALMCGVPVVTVDGDGWMARQSKSVLSNAGHEELVAQDIDDYIKIASDLAADMDKIQNYRTSLKQDMEASEMRLEAYVPNFEKAIWDMWSIKCQEQGQ
ncbi:MAG: tetratricopeptide repeat protein [Candidatus Melainabacteria bacterium]|nr:tetratricopeptide repeat protein [Candidatus Melainabacteria bacterium]